MAKLLKFFLQQTSIHGVAYLVDNRIRFAEKLFWLLALVLSCIGCVSLVWEVVGLIRDDPIITYTSDTPISIGEIPFVAVTLCPLTNTYNDEFDYDDLRTAILTKNISIWDLTEKELKYMQAVGLVAKDDFLTNFNISIDANDVVDYIVALKRTWHTERLVPGIGDFNNKIDFLNEFGAILAEIITPWGFCYCFNVVNSDELYHLDRVDPVFNYTRPIEFEHLKSRDYKKVVHNNASFPWKTNDHLLGLHSQVQLDTFDKSWKITYHENFVHDGSSYRFHSPFELPFHETNEYTSQMNGSLQFFVTPQIAHLDESLHGYSIEKRQCYFTKEKRLFFFKTYTMNNCIQECLRNFTLKKCGCVQFYMLRDKSTKICGIHDQKCTDKVEALLNQKASCKCLPLCDDTKYFIEVRQVDQATFKDNSGYKRHKSKIMEVTFLKNDFYPTIKQRQFTETNFLSYIGGTLGLFAGFSVLTIFEVFCNFVLRWFLSLVDKRKRKKVQLTVALPANAARQKENPKETLKMLKVVPKFAHSYLERSSVHGISHASQKDFSLSERIVWLVLFSLSIAVCCVLMRSILQKYNETPIVLSLDGKYYDVQSIPFPAVTITQQAKMLNLFNYFTIIVFFWDEDYFIKSFNETGELEKAYSQQMVCRDVFMLVREFSYKLPNMVEEIRKNANATHFGDHLSSWNTHFKPVFLQIPVSRGFGFSFNLLESQKMFKKTISPDFRYDKHTITTRSLGQSRLHLDHKDYPLSSGAKLSDGLEFLMRRRDQPENEVCMEASFSLHSSFELPNAYDFTDFCFFDYQKVVTVSIIPEVTYTDDALRSIDPVKRNCFFDGENELKYFKTYSKVNCEMECLSQLAIEKCNCTPFYFVRGHSTPLCYMGDLKCIGFHVSPKSLQNCGCFKRCNSVNYRFDVRSERLSTDYNPNSTEDVLLRFKFKESEFMPTLRYQPFTFVEFLAQAGGLLGLFVGASFLSVIEIFYFFTLRLFVNICRHFKTSRKIADPKSAWTA